MQHRDRLASDLKDIGERLERDHGAFKGYGFVEVRLTQDAWAKSNRPVDALFNVKNAQLVGGNEIADLIFRVSASSTARIANTVADAQAHPRRKFDEKKQAEVPIVSEARSETGAIESIVLWGAEQREAPSATEAIRHLKTRNLAAYYRVELFDRLWLDESMEPRDDVLAADFWLRIKRFARSVGLVVTYDPESIHPAIGVALLTGPPRLVVRREAEFVGEDNLLSSHANFRVTNHDALLTLLSAHPLVKTIGLPAVVEPPSANSFTTSKAGDGAPGHTERANRTAIRSIVARRDEKFSEAKRYPRVCVVDGGISDEFRSWVIHQEHVTPDRDENHGSNIASLLVAGKTLNPEAAEFLEEDGCELIDLAMVAPTRRAIGATYPGGTSTFLDQLDILIQDVKQKHPFRVVNMSLNVEREVRGSAISESARRLDEIARKHDVIFVVSAGNAKGNAMRGEWAEDPTKALQQLVIAGTDGLFEPADTLANISVAALNPPGLAGTIAKAPARYSRRGTKLRTVKPDLCHFGGAHSDSGLPTGLQAMDAQGAYCDVYGTSYAAPLIAKSLACLDAALDGSAPREVLLALLYHSARLHEPLDHEDLRAVAKQLVGFGLPEPSASVLDGDPYSFTFVVFDRLLADQTLQQDFKWPESLVNDKGGCSGSIKATLVSSPPLVHRFGAEASRMNIELVLRQATGKLTPKGQQPAFQKRIDGVHSFAPKASTREAGLLSHALKWSPVKVYEGEHDAVGKSSDWRLEVNYLERDKTQANMPADGIPVAIVVTISDPLGLAPVFNEMRASLTVGGLRLNDIRLALRTPVSV